MHKAAVLIFVACCALSALSLAKDTKKYKPSSSMAPAHGFDLKTTPTTTPKTTNTTTTTPTTTPKTTNTTTTASTTTASTTTPKTTNTTTTTSTTTASTTTASTTTPKTTNTTTTAAPTTTAPTPTPPTNMTVGNYTVLRDGKLCLMATMAIQIQLVSQTASGNFTIQPQQTNSSGNCSDSNANLTLIFKQGSINFLFTKNVADKVVFVDSISFSLNYPLMNEGNNVGNPPYTASNSSLHLFSAKVGHSYSCKTESIYMGNNLYLSIEKNKMQAFNFTNSDFGTPDPCPADRSDYRIAIAVGVTLLVLIIIVLVVYLLGRRKRANGYQSL